MSNIVKPDARLVGIPGAVPQPHTAPGAMPQPVLSQVQAICQAPVQAKMRVQTDASLGEDREHSAHAKGVHATKNDSQGGEKFSEVQCLIEEWERREGEVTEDRPSIHCSRRKSSKFLRKLSVYETGGSNVL